MKTNQLFHIHRASAAFVLAALLFAPGVRAVDEKPEQSSDVPSAKEKYDLNKDGKLSKEERAAMKADQAKAKAEREAERTAAAEQRALKRFDKNKDGVLDADEKAAWEAAKAKQKDQYQKRRAEELEKYDANKDGKLDKQEREALEKAREAEKNDRVEP